MSGPQKSSSFEQCLINVISSEVPYILRNTFLNSGKLYLSNSTQVIEIGSQEAEIMYMHYTAPLELHSWDALQHLVMYNIAFVYLLDYIPTLLYNIQNMR